MNLLTQVLLCPREREPLDQFGGGQRLLFGPQAHEMPAVHLEIFGMTGRVLGIDSRSPLVLHFHVTIAPLLPIVLYKIRRAKGQERWQVLIRTQPKMGRSPTMFVSDG